MIGCNGYGFLDLFELDPYSTNKDCYVQHDKNVYALVYNRKTRTLRIVTNYYDNEIKLENSNIHGFENSVDFESFIDCTGSIYQKPLVGFTIFFDNLQSVDAKCCEGSGSTESFLRGLQSMRSYIQGYLKDLETTPVKSQCVEVIHADKQPYYFFKKPTFIRKTETGIILQFGETPLVLTYTDREFIDSEFERLCSEFEKMEN